MAKTKLAAGCKVLVKNLSLAYSDYKNLPGAILEVHGEFASVLVPKNKLSEEDLRELRKVEENAVVKVKLTSLA